MSSKKKQPATVVPKPKYAIGQHLYTITFHKGRPEEMFECKVVARLSREYKSQKMPGRIDPAETWFSYDVITEDSFMTLTEGLLYPSFAAAAQVFAKPFLKPLK